MLYFNTNVGATLSRSAKKASTAAPRVVFEEWKRVGEAIGGPNER